MLNFYATRHIVEKIDIFGQNSSFFVLKHDKKTESK